MLKCAFVKNSIANTCAHILYIFTRRHLLSFIMATRHPHLLLSTVFFLTANRGVKEEKPKSMELPKNWFAYTEYILFSTKKLINLNCQYSYYPLIQLLHEIDLKILAVAQYMDLPMNAETSTKVNYNFENGLVKTLFGIIRHMEDGSNLPHKDSSNGICDLELEPMLEPIQYSYFYTWKFMLHYKLRLKVIVSYLYIALKNIRSCYSGYLSIRGFSIGTETLTLTYCGIHAHLEAYPPDRNISIELSLKPYVTSLLYIKYNIIDPHQNVSYTISRSNVSSYVMDYALYNWQIKRYIQKFHIIVAKWKVIRLHFKRSDANSYDVFDGPNPHFQKLTIKEKAKVTTTSFQCIIIYSFQIVQGNFQFKSVASHIGRSINISNVKSRWLEYPFDICNKSAFVSTFVSITEILTSTKLGINISIQYLDYTSKHDIGCQYAGLAAYSDNFDSKTEISSTCTTSSEIFRHRNIYSESHTVLLVIYSYKRSYELNAKVIISTTSCDIVKINACGLEEYVYLSSVNNSCTIHQIFHNLDKNILEAYTRRGCVHCNIYGLTLDNLIQNDKEKIKLYVTGNLRGK